MFARQKQNAIRDRQVRLPGPIAAKEPALFRRREKKRFLVVGRDSKVISVSRLDGLKIPDLLFTRPSLSLRHQPGQSDPLYRMEG